jgi:uncharacterized protein (DUF362 family)
MSQKKSQTAGGGMNRRNFLKTAAGTATALALPFSSFPIVSRGANASGLWDDPRVVVVRDVSAHSGSQIAADIVQVMMDEAIRRYTGISDIGEAYRAVFPGITVDSIIGIKVNCINSSLSTHPLVVQALTNGLAKMNFGGTLFPANNLIIWDRTTWELQSAGYTINTGSTGVRCFSSQYAGYSSITLNVNGSNQHPSNILTNHCDYLVSFGVLKNHSFAGVTFSMKNHYGSIQNPGFLHGGYCNPYVPSLNQQIRDVLDVQETLFIVDGIFGCYYGGPGGPPNLMYDGIILGEDRVAVDAVCRDILDDAGCTTINISGYIDTAANPPYNLGTADLASIDRIEVDNPSSAVENLSVEQNGWDAVLNWSTPEYSGLFKVQRSLDPQFGSYEDLITLAANTYIDSGAVSDEMKYFYRVLKTWD